MEREFELFGPSHLAALIVLVGGVILMVALGRRVRGTPREAITRRALALLSLGLILPWQIWTTLPEQFSIQYSLPFELCDVAWIVSLIALWTKRRWACGTLYYWGLTLTTQAMATPRLKADFPTLDFLAFWGEHLLVVWTAVFVTWGLGFRPGWGDLARTAAVTAAWAAAMFVFNSVMGTNYLFVNHKPITPSLLDILGPWPVYLGAELLLALAVWALITLPWTKGLHDRGIDRAR